MPPTRADDRNDTSDPSDANDTESAILEAARTCVGRVGVAKTTLEDVARTAGCSRATLYRYFERKDALLIAVVAREVDDLRGELARAAAGATDLADALTEVLVAAAAWCERHDALQFLLTHEPEAVLPHLAFEDCGQVLATGSDVVVDALGDHLRGIDAPRFAEWVTRLALSYGLSPPDGFELIDRSSARTLVEVFLVPAAIPRSPRPVAEVL